MGWSLRINCGWFGKLLTGNFFLYGELREGIAKAVEACLFGGICAYFLCFFWLRKNKRKKEKRWTESSEWGKMIQIEILDILLFCDLQRIYYAVNIIHTQLTSLDPLYSLSLSLSEYVCVCVATMKSVRFENQKATWFFSQSISPFFLETNGDFMLFIV